MLFFPQLTSGAIVQYPLERVHQRRSVVSRMPGGDFVKTPDPGVNRLRWDLGLRGLTDDERSKLTNLFDTVQGRLQTFTFLDPVGNLLRWSEDLGRDSWVPAGVSVALGSRPNGGSTGFVLSGSGIVSQAVDAPASHVYCSSIWARSSLPGDLSLALRAGTTVSRRECDVEPNWQRFETVHVFSAEADQVAFEIGLSGSAIEVWAPQLEAQPQASDYRPTREISGVHSSARFDQDEMDWYTEGPNDHACKVRVTAFRTE